MESKVHVPEAAQRAGRSARGAATSKWVTMLARLGYAMKGVVYLVIGILAVELAAGKGGQTTDQRGAIHIIYDEPFGRFLLIVVAVGLICFALWCFIQALFDTEGKGNKAKGILARVGYAAIGVSYGLLAIGTVQLLAGTGNGGKSTTASAQNWTGIVLKYGIGVALIVLVGLGVIGLAGYLFYRAYSANFQRKLALQSVNARIKKGLIFLGRLGYAALGVVFCIVGIFLVIAALQHDPRDAKGLDTALQVLLHQPFGPILLGIVALGLVAYGAYSFVEARYRRIAGRQFSM
ncbi:MAG TPA: DUF1206 domain-containing protein [Ktedonobacteraceae bacterium]|nr:DUF1206 domain-containing protein [Ktedonobacteraceae bacterium]